jgi:phytoene dehydrogenase-like protein
MCVLDYPVGGSAALVDALVRGLEKQGGQLQVGAHVAEILVEQNQAKGVRLQGGDAIAARKAVVSNSSIWDTLALLPTDTLPPTFRQQRQQTPECHSFMHLHLGIDATDLPADLACHHIVVNDWEAGGDRPPERDSGLHSLSAGPDPGPTGQTCHPCLQSRQ